MQMIFCLNFVIRSNVRTPAVSQRLPAPEVFRDHQRSLPEFGIWLERLPSTYIVALLCLNIHVLRFYLKFIYSGKATKFNKISILILPLVFSNVKTKGQLISVFKMEILSNFVGFSKNFFKAANLLLSQHQFFTSDSSRDS